MILEAGFTSNLIAQLDDEDTDRDAQITLTSLCKHGVHYFSAYDIV